MCTQQGRHSHSKGLKGEKGEYRGEREKGGEGECKRERETGKGKMEECRL